SGSACSTAWTAWRNTHTRQEACSSPPRLLCPDLERRGPATYARLETSNSKRQTSTTGEPDHVHSRRMRTGRSSSHRLAASNEASELQHLGGPLSGGDRRLASTRRECRASCCREVGVSDYVDFASRHPMNYASDEGIGMTPTHPFDNAIHLDTIDGNVRRGRTHPEWANQVGPFGGITAAVMLHAIETQPDRIGEPLALTVNFTAPIADGDFDISLRAARTNRTTQHW